jgi:ABC-type proline/glycine betaine transport system ATPase subunit
MRQMGNNEIQARVSKILDIVELPSAELAHRYPSELSGGQGMQHDLGRNCGRAALGRALR